jgi:hypothetical protein
LQAAGNGGLFVDVQLMPFQKMDSQKGRAAVPAAVAARPARRLSAVGRGRPLSYIAATRAAASAEVITGQYSKSTMSRQCDIHSSSDAGSGASIN